MIRAGADDADAYPIALVPAGKAIDDVDSVSSVEIVDCTFPVDTPDLLTTSEGISIFFDEIEKMKKWRQLIRQLVSGFPVSPRGRV